MKRILKVTTLMVAICVLLSGSIYTKAEPTMVREISKDILITSERSEIIIPTVEATVAESQPNYYVDVTDGHISENSLRSICDWVGAQYDISSELLQALVWVESTNKIQAISSCNAKGLCQIVEKWHKDRMERLGVSDIYEPYGNVLVCADFINELRQKPYGSDVAFVLMAYNMGTSRAIELYEAGTISQYATDVMNKAEELEIKYGRSE